MRSSVPPCGRDCVRTQIDHDQSTHYRTASVATGCRHSTPALLSLSRNYIGFELNGGIRSLRSRFCTERYSDARYLNAEFSHTLGSGWVLARSHSCRGPMRHGGSSYPKVSALGGIYDFLCKAIPHSETKKAGSSYPAFSFIASLPRALLTYG